LSPFPNAIFWNWATIFILAFGNLAALDFQVRCMAAKTPKVATWGCIIGGCLTFFVGIPFAYLGSITRVYYGPDSAHAEFLTDSCNALLGLPTCALWVPDSTAFIKLLTHQAPPFLGGWCLFGIVAASMSTAGK
jgi:Na+/proline symporter